MVLSTVPCGSDNCNSVKYQWFVNGENGDIKGATSKTLTITREMYEKNDFSDRYGIKILDSCSNSVLQMGAIDFAWRLSNPSITGSNGLTVNRIVTLCCDDNGGKLYRVDYNGTGQMNFDGYSHIRVNDAESGVFETISNGVNVKNATSPLYVYVKGDKVYWSVNKPDSYVMLNMTESICDVCSDNRSIIANIAYVNNSLNNDDFKNAFGLNSPSFTWEGSNDGNNWSLINGETGSILSGNVIENYSQFRVSINVGCSTLSTRFFKNCAYYPSVTISGTLKKCQVGRLTSTANNLSYVSCGFTFELQESEDEKLWSPVNPSDYSVSGSVININSVSSSYYRYVVKINGYEFPSNTIRSKDVAGVDLKVSYNKSLVYGVDRVDEVDFVVIPSDVTGHWEKLENGVWVDARGLPNISGAETSKLNYKITDNNHKAIFRFYATSKCTRSESVELKINEIDPICASDGAIIFSFNGMNAGQLKAQKSDVEPYMFIRPNDSRCYVDFPPNMHNSVPYTTGETDPQKRITYLGIERCGRIGGGPGVSLFPTLQENPFGKKNAYYIVNRNALAMYGGSDAVIPPSYFDNDMYYLWWHGGETYKSNDQVTLPKIYPMMGIQYPSEVATGSTGKISVRFWLITDGLNADNPCHFGFFSDRHGSKTVNTDGTLISTLEENPFYNQNCTLVCEATGETWKMDVNNTMMANSNNNDCLTEVKVPNAQPGWYTMTAEFVMEGMLTDDKCPVFYPMVLPYSDKVGVAVEYLMTEMNQVSGQEVQQLPLKPSICISAETACTSDAISLFVKGLEELQNSITDLTIRWYDEAKPNDVIVQQSMDDIAGNGVARFDTQFPEGVSYVTYRCEVEIKGVNNDVYTYKNYVQVGRDSKCYDCVYIGEDIENVVYTKETDIRILTSNIDLPYGIEYVWQWSDKRYNSESKWLDIPSELYTSLDGGTGIRLKLKKEDFVNHPYIRVVVKDDEGETHCSSNSILLTPMETKCGWEIKNVNTINPQEYEALYAEEYRIVFHVENNDEWINKSPRFSMTDIQDGTIKNIICTDKDIDGNWYYDVKAVSDYKFTMTEFCTEFSLKDHNYKSIVVRAIRECQSASGSTTRV